MTNQEEIEQTVTIDGTAYAVSKLSETARYCMQNIQDLQGQQAQSRAKVDQCEMAITGFLKTLREDIDANYDSDEEEGAE